MTLLLPRPRRATNLGWIKAVRDWRHWGICFTTALAFGIALGFGAMLLLKLHTRF
jgi:hypothetical protein